MILDKVVPTKGKTIMYQVNGTGRDSYISFNNGGLIEPRKENKYITSTFETSQPKRFTTFPALTGKKMVYKTDGSGRDTYISFFKAASLMEDFIK